MELKFKPKSDYYPQLRKPAPKRYKQHTTNVERYRRWYCIEIEDNSPQAISERVHRAEMRKQELAEKQAKKRFRRGTNKRVTRFKTHLKTFTNYLNNTIMKLKNIDALNVVTPEYIKRNFRKNYFVNCSDKTSEAINGLNWSILDFSTKPNFQKSFKTMLEENPVLNRLTDIVEYRKDKQEKDERKQTIAQQAQTIKDQQKELEEMRKQLALLQAQLSK